MGNLLSDPDECRSYLEQVGRAEDRDIDLFEASLALAAIHRPSVVIDKYRQHFKALCSDLELIYEELCAEKNSDDVHVQREALARILATKHAYIGDDVNYDDFQNIDIMRVIDRRLGMPITLCIIAISLCRAMGWNADGVNFPGHFLMRLDKDGYRVIVDPFQGCRELQASDMRQILKINVGQNAELSSDYYLPCSNRDVLLRLQNNMKYRLIDTEHYQEALEIVDQMKLIAPDDYRLDLDMAVLLARLERPRAAVEYLVRYIQSVKDPRDRAEAEAFLSELRSFLH